MKKKFPISFYNYTTFVGVIISGISFGLFLFLMVLEALSEDTKPYMGIITFIILPLILIIGLILILVGAYRRSKRIRKYGEEKFVFPKIDLNDPKQFTTFGVFFIGTLLLIGFSAFGSFKAYEYTDNDKFCGEMCHEVMAPEFTAYQFSPHSRVGCVKCHIGSGAEWFVKAKISGAYQVYSVLFNKYSRPIPTPIENLRPAQGTCEQCHWPKHFYSAKQHENKYYLSNEDNTEWQLNYLMNIGGGNIESGPTSGIHWHMNIAHEVNYASLDKERQTIPWISSKSPNGKTRIYRSSEIKISDDSIKNIFQRRMDCIDCHNRPTHIYHPPARSINHLISLGWIDKSLPFIKNISVTALETEYFNSKNAVDSIEILIKKYYSENYPQILISKKKEINDAIESVKKIYSRNYFPEMKVSWKSSPNNIGHMYSDGCFRCHDGKHVSDDGKVLSKDCNTCHTILAQQFEKEKLKISLGGIKYQHPVDIGDAWEKIKCSVCHNNKSKN